MLKNTLTKKERLSGKKNFEMLLNKGRVFSLYPFKAYWVCVPGIKPPARIAISIPKKIIKKAVDRNLVRRRVRESYRANKHKLYDLLEKHNCQLQLLVIYTAAEIPGFNEVNTKITTLLDGLAEAVLSDGKIVG